MLAPGCYRNEIRTVEISVGFLGGEECFKAIQTSVNKELLPNSKDSRIRNFEADYSKHLVKITFDARHMGIKNIEHAIAGAGFSTYDEDGKVSVVARGTPPEGCAQ